VGRNAAHHSGYFRLGRGNTANDYAGVQRSGLLPRPAQRRRLEGYRQTFRGT